MLDRLLGRAHLKDRVEELEDEVESLRAQLDAEGERRRDAVAAKQEAEEEVNRLEDRVEELRDRVERAETVEEELDFRGTADVFGERLDRLLARLETVDAPGDGALTAMVDDRIPGSVRDAFGERAALVERASPCLAVRDADGVVSATLRPPIAPEPFDAWSDGFEVEREWFEPTGEFALAVVRADLFALGTYDGRERTGFEGFESDVKSKHSKGGFSQGRFERRRDEQVAEHIERCEDALDALDTETVYVVGERTLLPEFAERAAETAPSDATGDPEDALAEAFRDFWTVRLRLI
ncbi:Vms1/Ankzf1 family peptidyl-tRNA hydrolase [Salarchaeum japonicum]|uniref:Vms1/Ankzf1 family peptidyl-tRNA hydrolase n=1 Tax=Salarchaeum japonicum TaxID=555573 RepID=A0AAV3SYI2_9EURY|nr:Vms1/Ankzf1 family peptidyl-tRNA hydrolase [Salarchaeum japonicum]